MRDAVSPSSWEPQFPLTAAESHVDWILHRDHIVNQRARVEKLALPTTRRLALSIGQYALPVNRVVQRLEDQLVLGLERSVRFGYYEAQREIRSQRGLPKLGRRSLAASSAATTEARGFGNDSLHLRPTTRLSEREARSVGTPAFGERLPARPIVGLAPALSESLVARYSIPDVGRYADTARYGLPGIYTLVRHRARQVATNVAQAAHAASWQAAGEDKAAGALVVVNAATRALHNSVLELVGEALNLGRTAGALEMRPVPEFALRSAQLDKSSCPECERLHGEIVQVDTSEYFEILPPADCFGGGRCRCIMVFGEQPEVAQPLEEAA